MAIGVDFGASYVDAVAMEGGRILLRKSVRRESYSEEFLESVLAGRKGKMGITGGGAHEFAAVEKRDPRLQALKGRFKVRKVGEMRAIAEGAKYLSGKNRFLDVNVGTGTPFVFVEGKTFRHVGGTGIGGGTLEALAELLLGMRVERLGALAKGGSGALDLKISDVMGGRLGKLPGDATASNFGKRVKREKYPRAEIAYSLLNMVSEAIGVMAVLAARSCGCKEVMFTGRVAEENSVFQERVRQAFQLFGGKPHFPEDGKYCTAIGAAILLGKK